MKKISSAFVVLLSAWFAMGMARPEPTVRMARLPKALKAAPASIMPMVVVLPDATNASFSLQWLVFSPYPTNQGVTNFQVSVGAAPGQRDLIWDIGFTNRFEVPELQDDIEYWICVRAESEFGQSLPSNEYHWPPPLTNYVKRTLQQLNPILADWQDKFSVTLTNPAGSMFWRYRQDSSSQAEQSSPTGIGPWRDVPGSVTTNAGPIFQTRYLIEFWDNRHPFMKWTYE